MQPFNRRRMLGASAAAVIVAGSARATKAVQPEVGFVVGDPEAGRVGASVLQAGGNALDAIVSGAFAVAVTALNQTGIGGYGGTAVLAVEGGRRIVSVDFNSAAPAAMGESTFPLNAQGEVINGVNEFGWLASGVPGILAGLELVLKTGGTWSLHDTLQPAIAIARDGFQLSPSLAASIRGAAAQFAKDVGSRKLYFDEGVPKAAGSTFRNPELADVLTILAKANSIDPFYRGELASKVAAEFQKNGGLVTVADMAAYQARLAKPVTLESHGLTIHTAPLTAGGLSVLQALRTLEALNSAALAADVRSMAAVESLRWAWRDRLRLLGDPDHVKVPVTKLLSVEYAMETAEEISRAIASRRPIAHAVSSNRQSGTIHLSSADRHGNFASLTLTHGGAYGARVTLDGLGITLGHGMSRFDTQPGHPNSPGPNKRPLHNMVPTIVTRDRQAILAAGGRGGRKIPNAMFTLLTEFVLRNKSLSESLATARVHTEGGLTLELESSWPKEDRAKLVEFGYAVKTAGNATLSAVADERGMLVPGMR